MMTTSCLREPIQIAFRTLLRRWAKTGILQGYLYQTVEKWGALLSNQTMVTRLPGGCEIECDLADHVQQQIYFLGVYEAPSAYVFTRMLRPGMTVIDGGANIGQYSLLASSAVGSSGSVHSFEPVPRTFAGLESNVARNHLTNVSINRVALWNEESELTLSLAAGFEHNLGAYSAMVNGGSSVTAPAMALDQYAAVNRLSSVDLMKMDIEGAELLAVDGAIEVLKRFRPSILMEVREDMLTRSASTTANLWDRLSALGYQAFTIGYGSQPCRGLPNLDGVSIENILFSHSDLPESLTSDWGYGKVLRWACSGW